jgi:hypothetical protein
MTKCLICRKNSTSKLCKKHTKEYIWDSTISGYRRKKRSLGSRYTTELFHKTETKLVKVLERFFGSKDIVTSYRPMWAISSKEVLFEFDIYIKSIDILVEYNGKQHYVFTKMFHRNLKGFHKQLLRDKDKLDLVIKNNKKLIIFDYTEPIINDYVINKINKEK